MKLTFENIIKLRDLSNELIPLLDDLCERYFEESEPYWMYYNNWGFGNDNDIYIYYSYQNYDNECLESGFIVVDIKTLLEFEKQM